MGIIKQYDIAYGGSGSASIDDDKISKETTYSSKKINDDFQKQQSSIETPQIIGVQKDEESLETVATINFYKESISTNNMDLSVYYEQREPGVFIKNNITEDDFGDLDDDSEININADRVLINGSLYTNKAPSKIENDNQEDRYGANVITSGGSQKGTVTIAAAGLPGSSNIALNGYDTATNGTLIDINAKTVRINGMPAATVWTGTQAQYDAITTKNPTTIYLIEG